MSLVLYAVTRASPRRLALCATGIGGEPLRAIRAGEIAAIVGEHEPPELSTENLWAFEAALEALMDAGPLLPARFATAAEDEAEIRGLLLTQAAQFHAALELVTGAVEFACREADAHERRATPTSGTEYLLARLDHDHRTRERRARLEHRLAGLYRARVERSPTSTAYLVGTGDQERFIQRATGLGQQVTGPWPPYSFTSIPRVESLEPASA